MEFMTEINNLFKKEGISTKDIDWIDILLLDHSEDGVDEIKIQTRKYSTMHFSIIKYISEKDPKYGIELVGNIMLKNGSWWTRVWSRKNEEYEWNFREAPTIPEILN